MTREKQMPTIEQSARALFDTHLVLSNLGIPFILDGGTLLGFYRDGCFAADDNDDIDLTCKADLWSRSQQIVDSMTRAGFDVYLERPRDTERHWSAQLSFKRGDVKIDLMFKEWKKESDKVWWTVYGGPRGVTYKAVPRELLGITKQLFAVLPGITMELRLETDLLGQTIFGIPERVEDYLAYRYGEWQTPVHRSEYSCYTTDRCIVKENTYEAI